MAAFRLFDLNPEQEAAVRTTEGPLLILAGAGSGKTRVITMRVAFMISNGVPPESILAVTFTNKAAKEMRERLEGLVVHEEAKKVTMSTFHALCVRILRQDIQALGYKKNFSIYDEGDQMGLIKKIITRTAAMRTPLAHVLSSAIGGEQTTPVVTRLQAHRGNVHLLCSDGLTKHVSDERIKARLATMTSSRQACEALLRDALDGGGTDNITLVVSRVLAPDAPGAASPCC